MVSPMSTVGVATFPRASINLYGLNHYLELSDRDPPPAELSLAELSLAELSLVELSLAELSLDDAPS